MFILPSMLVLRLGADITALLNWTSKDLVC